MCRWQRCSVLGFALFVLAGCAVNPGPDYRQAAGLITERTGAADLYDPLADNLVQQKVDALLADGLTVDEAVTVALLNNRQFQAAFYNIGVSRADLVQSGLFANPSINFLAKLPAGGGSADVETSLTQDLVDLWQIPVRKKIAKAQLDATIMDVAQQAIELTADVRTAAYQVITLRQSEATLRENLQLLKQSEDMARRRLEAGEATQLDVNLARSSTIDVQIEMLHLQRELRLAEAALDRQLNLSGGVRKYELHDTLPEPTYTMDQDAMFELALTQRLDARAAEYRTLAADYGIRQAYLKIFPSVSVGYNVEQLERRSLPKRHVLADTARASIANGALTAPTIQSRAERRAEKRQEINVIHGPEFSAILPLWDQNQAQIAKARFEAEQRCKEYENTLDLIASQVLQADVTLRNAKELVEFYRKEALPQATASLGIARRLYEAGEQGMIVVIEAQDSLVTRRRAYVRAVGAYAAALAELERVLGGRLPPSISSPASQPAVSTQPGR